MSKMAKKDNTKKEAKKKEKEKIDKKQNDEISITDDVRDTDYYHGLVSKIDVLPYLKKNGDFLLRKTDTKGKL